jgi:all-trans-retinol 13,14-reductase
VVVSNANPLCTLTELVEPHELDARYRARLAGFEPSPTCFKIWLGLRPEPRASLPGDYDVHLCSGYESAIDPLDPWQAPISVVRPLHLGAAATPPGREPVAITMLVPARAWARARAESPVLAERLGDSLIARVERQLLPGLRAATTLKVVATPETFAQRIGSPLGSIYGWHTRTGHTQGWRLGPKTPIDGLWLVGAWTRPGAGVTSVLRSGCLTGRSLLAWQARR